MRRGGKVLVPGEGDIENRPLVYILKSILSSLYILSIISTYSTLSAIAHGSHSIN
jgi:hypothetical protein